MSRAYARLAVAAAALSWLSNDLSFGAGMTCKRIDSSSQEIRIPGVSADAESSLDLPDSQNDELPHVTNQTLATFGGGVSAASGGSSSGANGTVSASNSSVWGATGISQPQVSLAATVALNAECDSGDLSGGAYAGFVFGDIGHHPTEATGLFQANSGDPTGTFTGVIDIIISVSPTGYAFLGGGPDTAWQIICGGSTLRGTLNATDDGWDVTGGIIVNDVWQDMSGSWPLDVNTVLDTSQTWTLNDAFTLQIDAWCFTFYAETTSTISSSSLTAGVSFTSSASIQ